MAQFKLEVVTPNRRFLDEEIEMLVVRTVDGDVAVLADHIPLVTPLATGILKLNYPDGTHKMATVCGGYMEVTKEKTTIVTDSAEWPHEIDKQRAEEAKKRAEERLKKQTEGTDIARAELALKRALNRLSM